MRKRGPSEIMSLRIMEKEMEATGSIGIIRGI